MESIPFHRRLGTRFLFLLSLVILAFTIVGWYSSGKITDKEFRKILHDNFHSTFNRIESFNELVSQMAMIQSKYIAHDEKITRLIVAGNRKNLQEHAVELKGNTSADALIILDENGTVLTRAHDIENYGDSLKSWSMVTDTIENKLSASAIVSDMNNLIIYSSAPVFSNNRKDRLVGIILTGYSINDKFLNNINRESVMDITIIRKRAVMASTFRSKGIDLFNLPIPYLEYQLFLKREKEFRETDLFGDKYIIDAEVLRNLDPGTRGSILLAIPMEGLLKIEKTLQGQYMVLFVAGFLMVLSIIAMLSEKILAPIRAITKVTKNISEGDLGERVDIRSGDEISVLADNFNRMIDSVQEKNLAIIQHQDQLEHQVLERTAMYRTAKEDAEEATKQKDKFISIVSHDLKAPIAAILVGNEMMLELIDGQPSASETKRLIMSSRRSCKKILKLIEDILNLSNITGGNMSLNPSFLDAYFVILEAMLSIEIMAEEKGINIINNVPRKSRIYVDPTLFPQVIQNLISNAIKFSKRGDAVTLYLPEGEPTTIAVSDNGVGIEPDRIASLFKSEIKTSTRGTEGEEGTGFGLPLSHDIVATHGGRLTVESEAGKGSVFYIKLPHKVPFVFIVGDDEAFKADQEEYLKDEDLEIVKTRSGEEAMEKLRGVKPDLVIAEIEAAENDRFKLLESIKYNPATKSVPVIILSPNEGGNMQNTAFLKGADDFIAGPLKREDFIAKVRKFVC